jgi:hypothetical protein
MRESWRRHDVVLRSGGGPDQVVGVRVGAGVTDGSAFQAF